MNNKNLNKYSCFFLDVYCRDNSTLLIKVTKLSQSLLNKIHITYKTYKTTNFNASSINNSIKQLSFKAYFRQQLSKQI